MGQLNDAILAAMSEAVYVVDRDRRITFWNNAATTVTGYAAGDVVGHRCRDGILNHVDDAGRQLCMGRCPLLATMRDGQPRQAHVYLHHADGHRVPVEVRATALVEADGRIVGAIETFHDDSRVRQLESLAADATDLALRDALTGLPNRRALERALEVRGEQWQRSGRGYSVLFVDLDRFKSVNDRFGHDAGDLVLAMTARTLEGCVRSTDTVGRWGGEEFLVVTADAGADGAVTLAERLTRLIAASWAHLGSRRVRTTASIGVAAALPGLAPSDTVRRADRAMLAAKAAGRNRVRVSGVGV